MSPKTMRSRRRRTADSGAGLYVGDWGSAPLRLELERRIRTTRPSPPDEVDEEQPERFVADAAFADWIRGTFIDATGPLANEEHEHLADAAIGVLWTNAVNVRQMRHVLATAEMPQTMGGAWKRARAEQQLRDWFECLPDFVLTFYAPECERLDDRGFCALVEHELLHCAQAKDLYGSPRFTSDGRPIFGIRDHDVAEFVSVVERYGPTTPDVARLITVGQRRPLIGEEPIRIACGTCSLRAA